jgi:hypothetical protein
MDAKGTARIDNIIFLMIWTFSVVKQMRLQGAVSLFFNDAFLLFQ